MIKLLDEKDKESLEAKIGENVSFTEPQELTPAQQAQARQNIGAADDALVREIICVTEPTNYANFASEDVVYNNQSQPVTGNGTSIVLTNNDRVNNFVALEIKGLTVGEEYYLSFRGDNLYDEGGSVRITRYAHAGGAGQTYATFTNVGGMYTATFTAPADSPCYLCLAIKYTVTTASATEISITKSGEKAEKYIRTELLRNIGKDNLSEELQKALDEIASENPCDYKGEDICVFSKGVCIGDSMTAGTFNHFQNGTTMNWVTDDEYSYPRILQRITGIDITNMGIGGVTSAEWYEAKQNADLSGHDFAIVQLGINDAIRYNGWTNTSIQAFTSIINKLKAENKNITIFVSTIIPATSYVGDTYASVSQGIRDFVVGLGDENVILLDLATYGHTGEKAAYNCGHLSAYGYWRLAKDYKAYISWYMNSNPDVFSEVQFVGTDYVYSAN